MKTPISYYGGKQTMLKHILPLIPEHKLYCEPFCGGAAVFFAKDKSPIEVINDLNGDVVNFYKVCKQDFAVLRMLIQQTPHSRKVHRESEFILKNPEAFSDIRRAWAFWVQANMSFSSQIFGGYAYERKSVGTVRKTSSKKQVFNKEIPKRFDLVDIECNDALKVIKSRDTEDTFFYVDPPYYNSDCGYYAGYSIENFVGLLEALEQVKGKFLLSSYPSEVLSEFSMRNNWNTHSISKKVAVTRLTKKTKTEVLTANYKLVA